MFEVMSKPTGAICNLDCEYCFFLSKESLYPGSDFRMSDDLLETYISQLIESQRSDHTTLVFQGGEPTMMGLPFFERMVGLVEKYRPAHLRVDLAIQTNGTLLTDEWCQFLKQHGVLVGLSMDGPAELHDRYRVDKGGKPTHHRVLAAWERLRVHEVDTNILCTVNTANSRQPLEVYHYFRDVLKAEFLQFIPIVEREGDGVTHRSVRPEAWGTFLNSIFDEWVANDVGRVFVQTFDVALGMWLGRGSSLCVFAETCGNGLALEHNGDLYSCDHFVDPAHKLGNIRERHMLELIALPQQRKFGQDKRDGLTQQCRQCPVLFACHGECPKSRFASNERGEEHHQYLCAGYYAFFTHIDRPMRAMATLLRAGRFADEVMAMARDGVFIAGG
jgi:uncharacterized protein